MIQSRRLLHPEEIHFIEASWMQNFTDICTFDIHKFEFEEYSRKNRMKTIKYEPLF